MHCDTVTCILEGILYQIPDNGIYQRPVSYKDSTCRQPVFDNVSFLCDPFRKLIKNFIRNIVKVDLLLTELVRNAKASAISSASTPTSLFLTSHCPFMTTL